MLDLLNAFALMLVIEGALYALFPEHMREMLMVLQQQPDSLLRNAGLLAAIGGVCLAWLGHNLLAVPY